MADHLHLVVSIPPRIAVAEFVGQVKGVASARFDKLGVQPLVCWELEYGVLTFDGRRLANVVGYVERQKEHHAAQTLIPVLERTDDQPVGFGKLREPGRSMIPATQKRGGGRWWNWGSFSIQPPTTAPTRA